MVNLIDIIKEHGSKPWNEDESAKLYEAVLEVEKERFINEVRCAFDHALNKSYYSEDNIITLKRDNLTFTEFVENFSQQESCAKLINNNWNKVPEIIEILRDYIKELEEEDEAAE